MNTPVFMFVYGSLRRESGHAMSRWLAARAVWQAAATVSGRLYRVSDYPALVVGECNDGACVEGDLYRLFLAETTLPGLDAYEGIQGRDDDEYERRLLTVALDNGAALCAWAYCYRQPVQVSEWIESGDWLSAPACHSLGIKKP